MKTLICVAAALAALFSAGCESRDKPDFARAELKITPDSGVAGVRYGESLSEVVRVLGSSNRKGWLGPYNVYSGSGPLQNLSVLYLYDPIAEAYPKSISTQVVGFQIEGSFSGTTDDGVGIGSSRNDVILAYGHPDTILVSSVNDEWLIYCPGGNEFLLGLDQHGVKMIAMAWVQPGLKHSPANFCD